MHVDAYKTSPLVAADKLSKIWCNKPTDCIDVWGCGFPCAEFFESFLDHCRDYGFLKEALSIWWCVHNCPGPEMEPCHHNYVCQQVIDYSIKYGLESETLHLKEHGLDKFKFIEEVNKLYRGKGWQFMNGRLVYDVYPNPKDEDGRFIPLIKNKDGEVIHWPRHDVDDRFLTIEEIDELGI
jgi:hypothetical protein